MASPESQLLRGRVDALREEGAAQADILAARAELERSLRAITIGSVHRRDIRREKDALEGLAEREEQFQVAISGNAEEFPVWSEAHLTFRTVFVDATGQRDSPFDRPHFTYGVIVESGGPVGVLACVTRWDVNDRNETIGCMLAIGPVASDTARSFSGEVHVRFQGYGAPLDAYGDVTQWDVE